MTQFNIGYRIEAKDATRSTLASALSGVTRFARLASKPITIPLRVGRKGLSLLRDINLGLRPLVGAIDNVIDRGARLEVVSKSFQSLTGKNAAQARRLAKELVVAASGTIKLSKAMEIANRALGSGIDLSQLTVAIEFISKKAITTGKNAEQSLEKVITGLSRGSTLFLDDFGILVDGIDGVRRAFDKVKGAGAFDSLGPAAQKAETIRQAIGEMSVQMGKIGVTGKETIFLFQGIKNQIGDSVEKLLSAVAGSKALREVLKGVRDTIGGISEFLERGGSFLEVLTGTKGGKSGGLLGIMKARLLDQADAFVLTIVDGILGGITLLRKGFDGIKGFLDSEFIGKIPGAISEGLEFLTTDFLPKLSDTFVALVPKVLKALTDGSRFLRTLLGVPDPESGEQFTHGKAKTLPFLDALRALVTGSTAGTGRGSRLRSPGVGTPESRSEARTKLLKDSVSPFANALQSSLKPILKVFKSFGKNLSAFSPTDQRQAPGPHASAGTRTLGGSLPVVLTGLLGTLALATTEGDESGVLDGIVSQLRSLRSRFAGDARAPKKLAQFNREFPPFKPRAKPIRLGLKPIGPVDVDIDNKKLSDKGFIDRVGEFNLLNREVRKIEGQTRRDARRIASQNIHHRERGGEEFNAEDRKRIQGEEFDRLLAERTFGQRKRIGEIEGEIGGDFKRRGQEAQATERQRLDPLISVINALIENNGETIERAEQLLGDLTGMISDGITALTGVERKIASAGGRRT